RRPCSSAPCGRAPCPGVVRSAGDLPWTRAPLPSRRPDEPPGFPCRRPGRPTESRSWPCLHVALATAHLHPTLLHEAVVVTQEQQLLGLLHGVQPYTHDDQEAGAPEEERLDVEDV